MNTKTSSAESTVPPDARAGEHALTRHTSDDSATQRTAVVTGSASGMGLATATLLAAQGWQVVGLDMYESPDKGETGRLHSEIVDVTDRSSIAAAMDRWQATSSGRIDLLANIAGIFPPSTLESYTKDQFDRVFGVNVLGTLNVTAEVVPRMRSGAVVVNFASVDAFTVSSGQLLYGASKAAVVMLTKELALELAPAGIRVNAIAPGWVDTPGNAATGRMEQAAQSIPLGRVAASQEIASWVSLLAEHSGFMTGETVVLSGGDVMR